MSDFFDNKIDFIIMIILALLVSFIIGFNIIQVIDSKLSSVTINVPPSNCQLPPIYLSIDKESGDFKKIKFNDVISVSSNESNYNFTNNEDNNYENNNENINNNLINNPDNVNNEQIKLDNIENFGNINDYPLKYNNNEINLIYDNTNSKTGTNIINTKSEDDLKEDLNYNTLNDIPLYFSPDTNVPNKASQDSKAYYSSKVKLIEDYNSPLMKLAKINEQKINQKLAQEITEDSSSISDVNSTFDGYNTYVDLRTDSYANVTSFGKSMLTPYISYPVPS